MSSNLLKFGGNYAPQKERRIIDTNDLIAQRISSLMEEISQPENKGFTEGLKVEEVDVSALVAEQDVQPAEEQAEAFDEESIRDRARTIIDEAKEAAGRILQEAIAQGEEESARIREEAQEQGYQEGLKQAQLEYEKRKQELAEKERGLEDTRKRLEAQYDELVAELEPKFIDTLSGIYEHLFHVELSGYRDVLLQLIGDCLRGTEGCKSFQIHVSKEDYNYVSSKKARLLEAAGAGEVTLEIVEDPSMHRNACVIKTEHGIMDCGLGTQLDELTRRLKLLAYEKK